jgi:periplasmic protein TonB
MRSLPHPQSQDYWSLYFSVATAERSAEHRRLQVAAIGALLLHGVLFALRLPEAARPVVETPPARVFRLQPLHLKPRMPEPSPPTATSAPPVEAPPIIVPGPPDVDVRPAYGPIPLALPDLPSAIDLVAALPQAPPTVAAAAEVPVPYDPSLERPQRIFAPLPSYTEAARRARRQGRVVVEAVIDADGAVVDARVLQGLGLGLDESALATVGTWRFTPARRQGRAIPVIYTLIIRFQLA